MITRRALVVAGAGALLAGCGREEAAPEREADVLSGLLAVELGLVEAYARVPGRLGTEHGAQAREHVARLREAIREAGGAPAPEPDAAPAGDPLEAALALERRAMAAYVVAVGRLPDPARRVTAAELLTADAAHAAALLVRLGRDPLESAFADGRAA